jgi:predicted RNA-binding Zn-ribbon protein involved in translation (DUF1610 family)
VSLGLFRELLGYKAVEAGVEVITVKPAYTSQACSGCGCLVPKSLDVRTHACPECGLILDRDVNAARNILSAGTRRSGANVGGHTLRSPRSSPLQRARFSGKSRHLAFRQLFDLASFQPVTPGGRPVQAADAVEQDGLARTRPAAQSHQATASNRTVNLL